MRTLLLAVTLCVAKAAIAEEPSLRLEAMGGQCQHRLAPDSSWHYQYGGYEINMPLRVRCLQLGLSVMPFGSGDLRWGFRVAYVDLGKIEANNTYPVNEQAYFDAKDSGTEVQSETARFHGQGGARGLTLGLASEYRVWRHLRVGPEFGAAGLYTRWHTQFNHAQAVNEGCRTNDWACADGLHWTPYAGLTVRWEWLQVSARRYFNVLTSQSEKNPLFTGPTTGPVDSIMVGLSIPL